MGDNEVTPPARRLDRPGGYGPSTPEAHAKDTGRPPPMPLSGDNALLMRELRTMREESARRDASTKEQLTKLSQIVTNLADRVLSHERELGSLSASKEADKRSADDTGRFHTRTIDRIHGRIDALTAEVTSVREKVANNRDFVWKVAMATVVGGGAAGGAAAKIIGAIGGG